MNDRPRSHTLHSHFKALSTCRRCPEMNPPVVLGRPVHSKVLLIGQAPGGKEGILGRPFAWTAGKTLFRWFESIGINESDFRASVYMAAVCRCFPGKNPKGGDRVPSQREIQNCAGWLHAEIALLEPSLVLPVGKLAINQFLAVDSLQKVIGKKYRLQLGGVEFDLIALPHPSGASTWHRTEPGKSLLERSLKLIKKHPAFKTVVNNPAEHR